MELYGRKTEYSEGICISEYSILKSYIENCFFLNKNDGKLLHPFDIYLDNIEGKY